MQACLSDAREGVYAARQPIGAAGDFITAPEISQIFGELLGLWCVAIWRSMGEPPRSPSPSSDPAAGRSWPMRSEPGAACRTFLASVSVALVELSPVLREAQRKALHASPVPLHWHADLDALPPGPLIVLANEFLDALPIHQYVRRDKIWRERVVTLDTDTRFVFAEGDAVEHDFLPPDAPMTPSSKRAPRSTTLLARAWRTRRRRAARGPLHRLRP